MKPTLAHPPAQELADRYHQFVEWEAADGVYVGYCPDVFPFGGVCHGDDPVSTYAELRGLVLDEVARREAVGTLPPVRVRPQPEPVHA